MTIIYLILTIGLSIFVWIWLEKKQNFWKNLGVHTPPYSLIWGHFRTRYFQGGSPSQRVRMIYDYVRERGLKYVGLYLLFDPWFVVMDLELIKCILQSDFQHFTDKIYDEVEGEPLTAYLLCLKGQRWKLMNKKLRPAFSSGKMKMMFDTFLACTHSLKKVMDEELTSPEIEIEDILETLRKFPPSIVSARTCTKDYKIPETDIILTKGMNVWIPTFGIHRDPKYYPDPEKFDPERLFEENKKLRHEFSFLGFGQGPRTCIGKRLGMIETKLGLITTLRYYEFSLRNRTKEPLQWDPDTPLLSAIGNIWLKHKKIQY